MPFYRAGKSNRSQHNLVGSTAAEDPSNSVSAAGSSAGAANPSSALSNTGFSSSESFQVEANTGRSNHTQPPPPSSHIVNIYNSAAGSGPNTANTSQLQHSNTVSGTLDSRQRDHDFADQVTRSQSHRYPQIFSPIAQSQQTPQQQQQLQLQQQSLGSTSTDDLSTTGAQHHIQSPIVAQPPQPSFGQQPQPPKAKQSTRKLIKNILGGGSSSNRAPDPQQQQQQQQQAAQQQAYTNTGGLARRHSKRVSNPFPPSIRTGVSQISLEQPLDWQNQAPPTQPSPLQGIGEFRDSYIVNDPDRELHLQNPHHDIQHTPTIRPVHPSETETSPYSADDIGYHHQQNHIQQLQGQVPPELQLPQQQYGQAIGQAIFDPSPQQQQRQYHQFTNQQQVQYQGNSQPVFTGHLGNPQDQNPETVSQLSHESPVVDLDQHSANNIESAQTSPAINYNLQTQDLPGRQNPPPLAQLAQAQTPQQQMAPPPPGGPPPARRSQETEKGIRNDQVQPPPGPPPSYRQSQQPNMNPLPQPPSASGQNNNYRQSTVPDRQQFESQGDSQGRNSPQPSSDRAPEDSEKFKDLLTKYKNVKRLYFDGKKEIELLNSQVEQLQNAIANQRMSQSRTSLDDNEYTTRFNRLNGAINNLSFNIRKDWVTLPSWLVPYVSADALKTGKQEMTALGRAVVTRWVVEEIFNRCFHPGLDPELSRQLKTIEHNIRHFSYTRSSQEEFEALTSKVVNWRMATLEGLQDVLRSGESANHKSDFTRRATSNLTACLFQHLTDPPPAGVDGSASMIVELAVGIASNLPLESRDVAIIYPLPEQQIQPNLMEVEKTGLPPLETRSSDASGDDAGDDGGKDSGKEAKDGRTRGGDKAGRTAPPPAKDPGKVRFAGFVAVEVRGRQVLCKAPVWTLG